MQSICDLYKIKKKFKLKPFRIFHVRKNGFQLNLILKVHKKIDIYNLISNKSLIYIPLHSTEELVAHLFVYILECRS